MRSVSKQNAERIVELDAGKKEPETQRTRRCRPAFGYCSGSGREQRRRELLRSMAAGGGLVWIGGSGLESREKETGLTRKMSGRRRSAEVRSPASMASPAETQW